MHRARVGAALAVSVLAVSGCHGGANTPEAAARSYFVQQTGSDDPTVTGSRSGSECAVVELHAPGGHTRGVAVVLQGPGPRWQAVGMSPRLTLANYHDDGDVLCGLAAVKPGVNQVPQGLLVVRARRGNDPAAQPAEARVHVRAVGNPPPATANSMTTRAGIFRHRMPIGQYIVTARTARSPQPCSTAESVQIRQQETTPVTLVCPAR